MRSVRIHAPGERARLEIDEIEVPQAGRGQVRIRVEACGVCHSDTLTASGNWPGTEYPRAPGHEIAGRIDAIGESVLGWNVGDRVGVGWHGGHCGYCDRCRRGDFLTCIRLQIPGLSYDGGYAEFTVVPAVALARIPDALPAVEAAPLMCAGVTTFNSLRRSGARPEDVVAVLGVGGLGHLGIAYAAKMGFHTVAIARGTDKEELARRLGASVYLDSQVADVASELQRLGGAKVVLSTVTAAQSMALVIPGLAVDGQLIVLGASYEPLSLNTAAMIGRRHSVKAWPSGTCADSEDAMNFSLSQRIHPMIETVSLDRAQEAYDRMLSGAARFRMVLTP